MKSNVRWCITGILLLATFAGGCNNAKQGAVTGVGVGALSGLAIGSLTGSAGKGAAIGAVVGGIGGAVIGDQNRRKTEAAEQAAAQPEYQTGQALNRLIGDWRISGSIDSGGGAMLPVTGTAKAVVDKYYFVHMDVHFTDPRTGALVDGTSVISQRGGRSLGMTNAFSTSPEFRSFQGEMDQTGTVFEFKQTEPKVTSRRIVIRLSTTPQWTADVWEGDRRIESHTFTKIGN